MSLWHCKAHFKLWQSSHISPPCTGIWVWFLGCTTYQPIAGVFVFEKLSEITSQNYGEKENLSVHIYLICIMKNTQQLLWLGFCLKETLRSVGSLRNTRKQVKSIFFSSLAGRQRKNSSILILPLDTCCQEMKEVGTVTYSGKTRYGLGLLMKFLCYLSRY